MMLILLTLAVVVFTLTAFGVGRLRRGFILSLLAGLLRQGLPVENALSSICSRQASRVLGKGQLRRLLRKLVSGLPLSDSLRACRLVTQQEACAVGLGQEHGVADRVLDRLASQSVRIEKRELRAAVLVFYPIGIGFALSCLIHFVSTFILPKLEQMLKDIDPSSSAILPGAQTALVFAVAVAIVLLLWSILITDMLNPQSVLFSWAPVIGTHRQLLRQARLARHFAVALEARCSLEEAVRAAASGYGRKMNRIRVDLEAGVPATEAFKRNGSWRPEFLWALKSIQEGAPPGMAFDTVAEVLEQKAEAGMDTVARYATPITVLMAGCAVGWLAYIVFSALNAIVECFV